MIKKSLDWYYYNPIYALQKSMEARLISGVPIGHPALDLGCGDGYFSHLLKDVPDYGIDPSGCLLFLNRRFGRYRTLIRCKGEHLPFKKRSFKTILGVCVLEHIPGFRSVLNECHRVLKKGGKLILTVPTPELVKKLPFRVWLTQKGFFRSARAYHRLLDMRLNHIHSLSLEKWKAALKDQGFDVTESKPFLSFKTFGSFERVLLMTYFGIGPFFASNIFRIIAYLLKSAGLKHIETAIASYWKPGLTKFYTEDESDGGLLFLVAVKKHDK